MIDGHADDIRLAALEARLSVIEAVREHGVELSDEQAEHIAQACIREGIIRGQLLTHASYVYYRTRHELDVERETRGRIEVQRRREEEQ